MAKVKFGDKTFTSKQVCDCLAMKRERLYSWISYGFITPLQATNRLHGINRWLFSFDDLARIAIFMHMVNAGVSRQRASLVVGDLNMKDDLIMPIRIELIKDIAKITINIPVIIKEVNEALK